MNRLAHEQAEHHLRQALELLASLPASAERDRRELWVQTRLGLILGTTAGLQTPEATTVFARSRALCASTGDVGVELPDLYGLFLFAWSGADEVAAHHQADQLLDLAAHSEDPKYLLGGHLAKGLVLFDQGALTPAGRHFERASVLADSLADPWLASVLYADPRVTGRLLRSHVLALTGPFEQSHHLAAAGLELARRIEHPFTEAVALALVAFSAVLGRRPEAAQAAAEATIEFCTARAFSHLVATAVGVQGWAMAVRGDAAAGLPLVRHRLAEAGTDSSSRVRHFHLALTAEVEQLAGLYDDALNTGATGLADAESGGSRFYEAELHRIRGTTLLAVSPTLAGEAAASFLRAAEVAREQGAQLLVLRAEAGLQSCRQAQAGPGRTLRRAAPITSA